MTAPITSPHNEQLKLVRKLAETRGRRREGLFATEGEDLLAAGLAAGAEPHAVLVAAGSGIAGTEVEPELLDSVSALGSGTRAIAIWPMPEDGPPGARAVYLDGLADPGNVGTIVRTAAALWDAPVVLGPGCADPWGPKAARATMGALFAHPPRRGGVEENPSPRLGLAAHGGDELDASIAAVAPATLCLGAEREGLGEAAAAACERLASIPLAAGAESLNVAASAAIALHRISSLAVPGAGPEGPGGGSEHA
jgi:RNA methyltransferase, TrmH family